MSNVNLATEQLLELLLTLKKTTPAAARGILNNQPAIAYALITLMVSMNAINIEVFQRTLAEFGAAANIPESSSSSTPTPLSAIPPHLLQTQYRTTTPPTTTTTTTSVLPPQTPPYGSYAVAHPNGQGSYMSTPLNMNNHGYGQPLQQQQQGGYVGQYQQQPAAYPGYPPPSYGGGQAVSTPPMPAPGPSSNLTDALASIPDEQKALIMRVLAMTPEQINMLPPAERSTYIQIRATLGISTG